MVPNQKNERKATTLTIFFSHIKPNQNTSCLLKRGISLKHNSTTLVAHLFQGLKVGKAFQLHPFKLYTLKKRSGRNFAKRKNSFEKHTITQPVIHRIFLIIRSSISSLSNINIISRMADPTSDSHESDP